VQEVQLGGISRVLVLGATAAFALALAGAAPTAGEFPQAQVFAGTYRDANGPAVVLGMVTSGDGPAPAKAVFYVLTGYALDLTRPPGTRIGETFDAYLTGDGFASGEGTVTTGDPATLPGDPAAQACAPGTHAAVWDASYKAGARKGAVRFYVDPTAGAEVSLGAYRLAACFVSPDATPEGPYFIEFELGIQTSVLRPPTARGTYVWRMLLTPYVEGTTTPNPPATFEARSHVLVPHVLSGHARYLAKKRQLLVSGRLLALGHARRGRIWIAAGPRDDKLRLLGRPRLRSDGSYALTAKVAEGRRPRVLHVWAFRVEEPGICAGSSTAPAGCVDESISPPASHPMRVRIPKLPKR
jgi:hypothetical protein